MAIERSIKLPWGGVDYTVIVTMELIRRLEHEKEGDLNLMLMVDQNLSGDVRFSKAATLIAMMLQSAGCTVTIDEVWDDIFGDDDNRAAEVIALLWEIFAVIFPPAKKKLPDEPPKN